VLLCPIISWFECRPDGSRQRRSADFEKWQIAETIYQRLVQGNDHRTDVDKRDAHSNWMSNIRPVAGPINIEHLPAMLASRNVKRYPFSLQNDPAIMFVASLADPTCYEFLHSSGR
jgi:hypothetical protein